MKQSHCQYPRRRKGKISLLGENIVCIRSPWVSAWWSATFPGFGYILVGQYIKGFVLVAWEIFINTKAQLNTAIILTFIGEFEKAKEILNPNWAMLYAGVYVFSIWDSYRTTVELNKYTVLADAEDVPVMPSAVSSLGISYSDKRHPWLALFWSVFAPGMGILYAGNIVAAVLTLTWWVTLVHLSHFIVALQYTCTGEFTRARGVLDPQWLLFIPSAFAFILYSTYVSVVEYNCFFDAEQARYLKSKYQHANFFISLKKLSVRGDG
ncbi:Hypothetical protein LUCI_2175 [Lucifera butyrica]|uniref:Uncharacterized protein n=1 Tax=Lucifera butyrica TaxID=1351585 RepID=A0A498R9X2_9FIRM|nr:hypothetical protein [Lucifera butyrica]VBB06933.1 Hypothetical protein LUCI_2175 [Lucifera butyrica]